MAIKTIGVLSDLHCGSSWALTPPSYWNDHTPDAVRWLWKCWRWLAKNWPELDLLILNGDMIDGKQHRSAATGLVSASLETQTDMATESLELFASKAKKIIRLEGTAYHESFEGPLGKLDSALGIKRQTDPVKRFIQDIQLDGDAVLNVKHQPEGEGTLYRGTALDREVLWACVSETLKKIPRATHIVRSHLHSTAHLRGFGKEINFTPGWCLQTPYALHKRQYRWIPDIGGTLLQREKLGHHDYIVVTKTFDLPERPASAFEDL